MYLYSRACDCQLDAFFVAINQSVRSEQESDQVLIKRVASFSRAVNSGPTLAALRSVRYQTADLTHPL